MSHLGLEIWRQIRIGKKKKKRKTDKLESIEEGWLGEKGLISFKFLGLL